VQTKFHAHVIFQVRSL